MNRILLLFALSVCLVVTACGSDESIHESPSAAKPASEPKPLPPRRMRTGPADFSTIEPELLRYADWYGHMTALQQQEALAKNDGPIDDFGRKLVGRTLRFAGRVEDVKQQGGRIVVNLAYQPGAKSGRVKESGEGLQALVYSKAEWKKRRAWRLSIELPDDAAMRQKANLWGKGQWLSFDGRVESTEGFRLERTGTNVKFASNKQVVHVSSPQGTVGDGEIIGPGSRVTIVLDRSGSMMDVFGILKLDVQRIICALPTGASFNIALLGDRKNVKWVFPDQTLVTPSSIHAACESVDAVVPEGQTEAVNCLTQVLEKRPTHLILLTDCDFNGAEAGVRQLLRTHQDTHIVVINMLEDTYVTSVSPSRTFENACILRLQDRNHPSFEVEQGDGPLVSQIVHVLD